MYNKIKDKKLNVNGITISFKIFGSGYPLLLLHGYPQSKYMWRKIAPLLAEKYTVVCSDLRGYGKSDKPESDSTHTAYSKKTMAKDQYELMRKLGYTKFSIIGHDRGARVAHRMALDYTMSVDKLILLDILPTPYVFSNTNQQLAENYFHWFFLIQKYPFPENIIKNNPSLFIRYLFNKWGDKTKFLSEKDILKYINDFKSKGTIHASCEDYRAAASIDLDDHKNDRKKIDCPLLILWGEKGIIGTNYDPIKIWKAWSKNVTGFALKSGHFIPEETPEQCYVLIKDFLK